MNALYECVVLVLCVWRGCCVPLLMCRDRGVGGLESVIVGREGCEERSGDGVGTLV